MFQCLSSDVSFEQKTKHQQPSLTQFYALILQPGGVEK